MRHHRYIWMLTAAAVALAAAVVGLRRIDEGTHKPVSAREADTLVSAMYRRLDQDPLVRDVETRAAIERVAALAEQGGIKTADTYYALGRRLQGQQQWEQAASAYRKAIALRPEWPLPYDGEGVALYSMERYVEAEQSLRKAIELDPLWSRPHNDLAVLLRLTGRKDEAMVEARQALALSPDDVAPMNNYGNLLVTMGRYKEAEAHYRKAIELAPNHPAPYYNMACLENLRGRSAEVFPYLERAIALDPAFRDEAARDRDLNSLRDHPRFRELVEPSAAGNAS